MRNEQSEIKKLNWATELNDKVEGNKALLKAKAIEKKLIKERNYRWYDVTPTYRILVPCDAESGKPTEEGVAKIKRHKEMLNIV